MKNDEEETLGVRKGEMILIKLKTGHTSLGVVGREDK